MASLGEKSLAVGHVSGFQIGPKPARTVSERFFRPIEVSETEEYFVYPQGVCRIRKPACAGNGCAVFPVFDTEEWAEKIRSQSQTI